MSETPLKIIAMAFLEYIEFADHGVSDGWSYAPNCPVCGRDGPEHHEDCSLGEAIELAKKAIETDA